MPKRNLKDKKLFLSVDQAIVLAARLNEYSDLKDSKQENVFKGVEVSYSNELSNGIGDGKIEITPIPCSTLIGGKAVSVLDNAETPE